MPPSHLTPMVFPLSEKSDGKSNSRQRPTFLLRPRETSRTLNEGMDRYLDYVCRPEPVNWIFFDE